MKLPLKVHNPGVTPDGTWNYLNLSDITVIFENDFSVWLDRTTFDTVVAFQNVSTHPKSQLAVMLHSLPDISDTLLQCIVKQLDAMADWLFVTDVGVLNAYYHSFSGIFNGFVKAVDEL